MQDDQTNQQTDNGQFQGDDPANTPGFSLGSNPSQQQSTDYNYQNDGQSSDDHADSGNQNNDYDDSGINPQAIDDIIEDHGSAANNQDSNNELDQIKEDALNQLVPIIEELDQPPEEKYRTLMMLIQASDDKNLIKSAYDAANKIEDKKQRAEALLNIVNEINYFSSSLEEN